MNYESESSIHSEEIQEVMGTPPRWIVRWGTTVSLFVLIVLGWLAWTLKYPEKLEAPITITSSIPPTDVIAQEKGYVERLLKNNNDTVQSGDLLGIIQSTTKYEDVEKLEAYLASFDRLKNNLTIGTRAPDRNLELGEDLQRNYSTFIQSYEDYLLKVQGGANSTSSKQYQREIEETKMAIAREEQRLVESMDWIKKVEDIMEQKQTDYVDEKIPMSELEKTSNELSRARRQRDQHMENIRTQQLAIERIEARRSSDLQAARQDNQSSYVTLRESVKQLRSEIDTWRQRYLLEAPADGIVTYFGSKQAAIRFVPQGEVIMAILPIDTVNESGKNEMIGRVSLPIEGSGKVKEGQIVKVRLESYPAHEYGLVEGIVAQKARLPRNKTYNIEVHFPDGLITSFNSDISYDQQMTGTASILTGRQRFGERIFEKFLDIFEAEEKM
jgi:multidrug efflux pump subunit AcrA (membrane-fusion protein)